MSKAILRKEIKLKSLMKIKKIWINPKVLRFRKISKMTMLILNKIVKIFWIQANRKVMRISVNNSHPLRFKMINKQKTKNKSIISNHYLNKIQISYHQQRKKGSKSSSFLKKNSKKFSILILELIIHLKLIKLMNQITLNKKKLNKMDILQMHFKERILFEQNNLRFLLTQLVNKNQINIFLV